MKKRPKPDSRIKRGLGKITVEGRVLENSDVEGKLWKIVCIQEGWSLNGIYWTRDAVEGSTPIFEGLAVNAYQSTDTGEYVHLSAEARAAMGGESPAGNNAGLTAKPRFEVIDGLACVVADYHCTDPKLQATAAASVRAGVPCPIGFSIDGQADLDYGVREGRRGIIGHAIETLNELTPVTRAAAGGRTLRVVAGAQNQEEKHNMKLRKFLEAALRKVGLDTNYVAGLSKKQVAEAVAKIVQESAPDKASVAKVAEDFAAADKEEEAEKVLEPLVEELEKAVAAPAQPADAAVTLSATAVAAAAAETGLQAVAESVKSLLDKVNGIERKSDKDKSLTMLNSALEASKLPASAQNVVRKRYVSQIDSGLVLESADLAEAIEDQRKVLAESEAPSGVVQEGKRDGNIRSSVGTEPIDRIKAGLYVMFDGQIPKDVAESDHDAYKDVLRNGRPTIKELYILAHDDPGMRGVFGPNAIVQESNRADFPETVGLAMTKQLVKEYTNKPQEWRKYVTINPDVNNYKENVRILQGGIGRIPQVAEGDGYGADTYVYGILGREDVVKYTMTKHGLLIGLPRELLLDDDMQSLRNIPKKLGKACRYTMNRFVYALQIGLSGNTLNNVNAYTGYPIYDDAHGNKGTQPWGQQAFIDMISRQMQQREYGGKWTLNGNITTGTSWTLISNRGIFPGMHLLIKGEIVTVQTVNVNGTGITVDRPAPINHNAGEKIYELLEEIEGSVYHFTVPKTRWAQARELFYSEDKPDTANNNGNVLKSLAKEGKVELHEVHEMYLNGNKNNTYCHLDSGAGTGVEMAFLNGNENPEIFIADIPNVGTMLRADQTDMKCRLEMTGAMIDPQMVQANYPPT